MKKFFVILSLCALFTVQAAAQEVAIPRHSAIECSFTQRRNSSMMDQDIVCHGKMYYKQPDKLRWEYTDPYKSVITMNGAGSKMNKGIARILMGCIEGKFLTDTKAFQVEINTSAQGWTASLMPLRSEMKQLFQSIEITFDNKLESVVKVQLFEKTGEVTTVTMHDIKLNGDIDDSVFSAE